MIYKKVIDQNFMREPNKILYQYLKKGNIVVLTEYCCMESYKGDSITNLIRSLEIISKFPNQVKILKSNEKVIRLTLSGSKGIHKRIIDGNQTKTFSKFVEALKNINEKQYNKQYKYFLNMSNEANDFFKTRDHYSLMIIEAIQYYKELFTDEDLKILRRGDVYSREFMSKITNYIMQLATIIMKKSDFYIESFYKDIDNYLFRFSAAIFFLVLKWISEGGIENIKLKRFQNDIIDMTYSTYGTYFDGVLTNDKKVIEIYKELKNFLRIYREGK